MAKMGPWCWKKCMWCFVYIDRAQTEHRLNPDNNRGIYFTYPRVMTIENCFPVCFPRIVQVDPERTCRERISATFFLQMFCITSFRSYTVKTLDIASCPHNSKRFCFPAISLQLCVFIALYRARPKNQCHRSKKTKNVPFSMEVIWDEKGQTSPRLAWVKIDPASPRRATPTLPRRHKCNFHEFAWQNGDLNPGTLPPASPR